MSKEAENKSGNEEKESWNNDERIEKTGQTDLSENKEQHKIYMFSIIGEIEGHDVLGSSTKSTKYEHILPKLAEIEDNQEIDGILILLNTMGGDVEAGLAIAEMIASVSKPTVSLVLGGSHSIGVPIAVSTDYSFIVPTGTMVIHPVRLNGMVIGVAQAVAVLPGLSRSGSTIATGLLLGNSRKTLAQFSFLMVIPPILGEAIIDFKHIVAPSAEFLAAHGAAAPIPTTSLIVGFIAAFVSGCFACKWMISIVRKGKLIWFGIYCAVAGILTLIFL